MIDLAASIQDRPADAAHLANDVAVSKAGVAYVTDSGMKIVYKVDKYYWIFLSMLSLLNLD